MPELPPAGDTRCPRCGGAFHCGANDPGPCACTTLKLDAATLAGLAAQYRGCLCLRCLGELAGAPERGRAPGHAGFSHTTSRSIAWIVRRLPALVCRS